MTLGLSPAPVPVAPAAPALTSPASAPSTFVLTPTLAPAAAPTLALPSLQAAAAAPELPPNIPTEDARAAAAIPFGESLDRPVLAAHSTEPSWERPSPRYRLAPLGFEDLTAGEGDAPPAPGAPRPEAKPFLLRHYQVARFFVAPLVRLAYKVGASGLENIPDGGALIVPNHVSFLDPILLSFAANRPIRFVMYRGIYETYGLQWLFRSLGAIPISSKDPKDVIERSLYRARRALSAGETVVVFPEGQLTRDGEFNQFRRGFERVAAGTGAPVIPAYVDGMWGSAFSRHPGASIRSSFAARLRGRRRVGIRFGPALERADYALARNAVGRLRPRP